MALDQSRGIETPASKLFMRLTVVVLELFVYIPALVMFARVWQGSRSKRTQVGCKATTVLDRKLIHSPLGTSIVDTTTSTCPTINRSRSFPVQLRHAWCV